MSKTETNAFSNKNKPVDVVRDHRRQSEEIEDPDGIRK